METMCFHKAEELALSGNDERALCIKLRNVYGRDQFYPFNETARLFAQIAGTKTLLPDTLALARKLGYRVVEVY